MSHINDLIEKLYQKNDLAGEDLLELLRGLNPETRANLLQKARQTTEKVYQSRVFLRGLVEFTSHCRRDCLYCGLRRSNQKADRYRLSPEQILEVCRQGYDLGYRTFVLQGGEDSYFTDVLIENIVRRIKERFPDCAVTLSIGERDTEAYLRFYRAGADRYLLRHETASAELYDRLHPDMDLANRRRCLYDLKEIGYQVGAGFMVGLPGQTDADYVQDLQFLQELQPQMVGLGPFIPHRDTPLAGAVPGTVDQTVTLLALVRLLLPEVLLPATTALGTIDPLGREQGLKAGANVVMPNLSPVEVRKKYELYDNKVCTGEEAAECRACIDQRITRAGFIPDMARGDHISWERR